MIRKGVVLTTMHTLRAPGRNKSSTDPQTITPQQFSLSVPDYNHNNNFSTRNQLHLPVTPTTDFESNSSQVPLFRKSNNQIIDSHYFQKIDINSSTNDSSNTSDLNSSKFNESNFVKNHNDKKHVDFLEIDNDEDESLNLSQNPSSSSSDNITCADILARHLDRRVLNCLYTTKEVTLILIDLFPFVGALWFMLMLLYNFFMNDTH